jgi:lipopolysaccharide/colanic/teichoic acid biosynthesis glycosyltransferase
LEGSGEDGDTKLRLNSLTKFNKKNTGLRVKPAMTTESKSGKKQKAISQKQNTLIQTKMKRLFDIIFSVIALLIFAIPIIIISLLLIFKERHSVLFKQDRIGKNKQPFQILKFQTMINEIPTNTGKLLRKTGLDELPQFINVLKGDMSIVGPRALTKYDIERLDWNDDYHAARWKSKPGITGFAQIYGGQHRKTSWFWDKYYNSNNNVLIDFGIVGISFLMNIFGKTRVRQIVFQKKNLK